MLGLSTSLFWFLIALVLGGIEILTLSFFLIWLAIAALITAVVTYFLPDLGLAAQLVIFAIFSVALLIPGRRWVNRSNFAQNKQVVNDRAESMIDRLGEVVSGKEGMYRVKIGDTEWGGRGDRDLKVGDMIRVVGVDGIMLRIELA